MASILLRVPVDADEQTLYDTVATSAGVKGWWSSKTEGPAGVGSTMKVAFPDAPITFDFKVVDEAPNERVRWQCLAGPPEWIGTDVSFEIEKGDDGTRSVLFRHDGWKTTDESFPFIAYSWAQILPRLKQLAENGERNPYFNF
ncbi:MAG: SRPBCC family protein [Actinomycetota bacterium]